MSVIETNDQLKSLIAKVGKNTAAVLFPTEIELYVTALELVDSEDKIVEYFIFPLNPTAITESKPQLTTIKNTAQGVSSLSTTKFIPTDITLQGDFGRKFKILVGLELIDFSAFTFSEQTDSFHSNASLFSSTIKTGFGCINVLQRIIKKSSQLDKNGVPYSLHLYNLSQGKSYLVKVVGNPTFSLTYEKNMIHQYNVQFKSLATLDQISKEATNSITKIMIASEIQKTVNNQLNNLLTINDSPNTVSLKPTN